LEYDNAHKPAITRELSETMGLMSAAQAAKGIIKGIQKGKHTIMPSLLTKILKPFASPLESIMRQMAISKVKNPDRFLVLSFSRIPRLFLTAPCSQCYTGHGFTLMKTR
jgi:hypothetical protein